MSRGKSARLFLTGIMSLSVGVTSLSAQSPFGYQSIISATMESGPQSSSQNSTPRVEQRIPSETTKNTPTVAPIKTAAILDIPPIRFDPPENLTRSKVSMDAPVTTVHPKKPTAMALDATLPPEPTESSEPEFDLDPTRLTQPTSDAQLIPDARPTSNARPTSPSIQTVAAYSDSKLPEFESATDSTKENSQKTRYIASREETPVQPEAVPSPSPVKVAQARTDPPKDSGLLPETTNDGILPPPNDYQLTQSEAELLDQFLNKWEDFGRNIKKVACYVESKERGGGLYGEDKNIPLSHNYGTFRFIAPNKLSYHVQGEYVYDQEPKAEDGKVTPEFKKGLGEKKFVLDGKSLTEYDFKNRVALVTPIPEDQQNKDLTLDGPIPIFFIAKAANLKRRFYLKIITPPKKQDSQVWIEAWPRQSADAQSFQRIIITLNLADLQPIYMRQYHANGKSYSELWFLEIAINKGLWNIEPKLDFGWKREEAKPAQTEAASK